MSQRKRSDGTLSLLNDVGRSLTTVRFVRLGDLLATKGSLSTIELRGG